MLTLIRILCFLLLCLAVPASSESRALVAEGGCCLPGPEDVSEPAALAGSVKRGKPFTKSQKKIIKEQNALENEGKNRCENCGAETVPGKKHEKGVTPPSNETQVDHKTPRVKGGTNEIDNGQVLCRDCNIEKGSKDP
jgi:hypothetical protein